MAVGRLQHFLVITKDVETSAAWYQEVLGLRRGRQPGYPYSTAWLYIGDQDVLHLRDEGAQIEKSGLDELQPRECEPIGTGIVDHVAFGCHDLEGTLLHLRRRRVPFLTREADPFGLFQIFLYDPNGVKIELNFPGKETEGLDPEFLKSNLAHAG